MMNRMTLRKQRRILRSWIKWVPVVAIPFAILFFHTWLNVQIIRADYVLRELDAEAREWTDRLNHTGVAETIHEDPSILAEQAEVMAFRQPSPGQREVIHYDPTKPVFPPEDENIAIAQRDGMVEPEPAVTESLSGRVEPDYVEAEPVAFESVEVAPAPEVAQPVAVPPTVVETTPAPAAPVEVPTPTTITEAPLMVETSVPLPALDGATAIAPAPDGPAVVLDEPGAGPVPDLGDLEAAMESLESL